MTPKQTYDHERRESVRTAILARRPPRELHVDSDALDAITDDYVIFEDERFYPTAETNVYLDEEGMYLLVYESEER